MKRPIFCDCGRQEKNPHHPKQVEGITCSWCIQNLLREGLEKKGKFTRRD